MPAGRISYHLGCRDCSNGTLSPLPPISATIVVAWAWNGTWKQTGKNATLARTAHSPMPRAEQCMRPLLLIRGEAGVATTTGTIQRMNI